MSKLIIPSGYASALSIKDTQHAIKYIKDHFERQLAKQLNLTRVSAPLFVRPNSGLNDNLNGVERPVSFDILNDSHILLSGSELNIKKLIVYNAGSGEYYRDYIYLETAADQPCGTEKHSEQVIQDFVQSRGYYSEEFAVFQPEWDSPEHIISRKEYDNGAAVIDGSVVPLKGRAKLRVRYLTPFNFIIAAKNSPYNCREFDVKSGEYLNRLLNDGIEYKEFHEFLMSLRRRDQDY